MGSSQLDPVFDACAHNIVSLDSVFKKDKDAIHSLRAEFIKRGWCIVRLPTNPESFRGYRSTLFAGGRKLLSSIMPSTETIDMLNSFFALGDDQKASYGYSSVPHKESVHIVTPLYQAIKDVAGPIRNIVEQWIRLFDELSLDLIEVMCEPIFGCSKATLSHRADLPVAFGLQRGMLDVAFYKNQKVATLSPEVGHSTEDVNCVPHYDPGLLSLSFLSTHDGLQLQDPETKTWFAGPVNTREGQEDLGVIWLGDAAVRASNGNLRVGVHRVVYPQVATPRMAVWYEMCTVEQLNQEMYDTIPKKGTLSLPNLPGSKSIEMKGDVRLIERHYGIPESKVMKRSDSFAAAFSEDVKDGKEI